MTAPAAVCLDDLARALDRARAAHERRPDNPRLYAAMLEAEVAYLTAELARRDRALGRERMRAVEIARRLNVARQSAMAAKSNAGEAMPAAALVQRIHDCKRRRSRRASTAPAPLPLLEFAGLSA